MSENELNRCIKDILIGVGLPETRHSWICPRRYIVIAIMLVAAIFAICTSFILAGYSSASIDEHTSSEAFPTEGLHTISAAEAHNRMISNRVQVIDVRTQEEFEASHIANAKFLPHDEISADTASKILIDKDEPVFVYCRTGVRSAIASERLYELGYRYVYDFGGIENWPYDTIDAEEGDSGSVENNQLPVGVKVVCGKTRSL